MLNSIESRIVKFVEHYRIAYRALLQLDPSGDWQEVFLELKDSNNRGPGKENDEEGTGDGSYFRSWIWLPNPRVPDGVDGKAGEEGASEEDINEVLCVEWTTSFARLERWVKEVELLQEEMRRVIVFLEWKSVDWSGKVGARNGSSALDIQSGLNAYAKKQAAIYHGLAMSFAKFWRPTLMSYGLEHSWATKYLTSHGVSLTDADISIPCAWGIFKFRLSNRYPGAVPVEVTAPSDEPVSMATTNDCIILEEAEGSEDSGLDSSDSDSEDWDDDLDL